MIETITVGARYHRPSEPKPVYSVLRMMDFANHLPHVTLVSENVDRRSITIGLGVLRDPKQWVPAE